jgi:hypothetical protein
MVREVFGTSVDELQQLVDVQLVDATGVAG